MRWLRAAILLLVMLVALATTDTAVRAAPAPTGVRAADGGVAREIAPATVHPRQRPTAPEDEAIRWLQDADLTQTATRAGARLRFLGGAQTCAQASYVTYRRSDVESTIVDQWYLVSQLWADAVLLAAPEAATVRALGGDATDRCHLDKGFIFLERLWDVALGGYYPRSDLTGTHVERSVRFTDDNSLAGLALIEAAKSVGPGEARQRYLDAARREATFLMTSGLWDGTFGGGFWWNTNRGNSGEGKPTQSNALAALFFARLYRETGTETYRTWSLQVLGWLDSVLYDPSTHLYRWSISYANPATRTGSLVHGRYFNYDQAIAIEAQLDAADFDNAPARRSRARDVGAALHPAFWGQERGGYNLEAGIEQVYTSYAAWTSLGHLALYRVDRDPRWLDLARGNADALVAALRRAPGSYGYRHYRCVDTYAPGCESGQVRWVVDPTFDTSAQAWLQHLQASIGTQLWPPPTLHQLTIQVSGSAGTVVGPGIACNPDCSDSYPAGTSVSLTANPAPGSAFVGWGGACSGAGSCQVTMDAAKKVTATFKQINAGVTVGRATSAPPGGVVLQATLTARATCGPIDRIQFGETGRALDNAKVSIVTPAGGPSGQAVGFTYAPPTGTTAVAITIERVVPSGGATVNPIRLFDGCGEWPTFVGGGPDAFR